MIYYSLTALMLASIRDILIISTPRRPWQLSAAARERDQWGLSNSYAAQPKPEGSPRPT